jgi:hypothetical protein
LNEDDDVAAERERIYSDPHNHTNDVLRMVDLVKVKHRIIKKRERKLVLSNRFMDQYLERIFLLLNRHVSVLNKVNVLVYWVLMVQESQRHLKC